MRPAGAVEPALAAFGEQEADRHVQVVARRAHGDRERLPARSGAPTRGAAAGPGGRETAPGNEPAAGYSERVTSFAAVVLAGGAGRRMGGADKPAVRVGGQPMRDRVLAAVSDASPRVVVGPPADLPPEVMTTREDPPGGGPVAAAAAGLRLIGPDTATVALLAADLPFITAAAVAALRRTLAGSTMDGACYLDADGRSQLLCGVWRVAALRAALDRVSAARDGVLAGAAMRALFDGLDVVRMRWTDPGPPPWFDCDTDDDVRLAEEWVR